MKKELFIATIKMSKSFVYISPLIIENELKFTKAVRFSSNDDGSRDVNSSAFSSNSFLCQESTCQSK